MNAGDDAVLNRARTDRVLVRRLDDGVLVYDCDRHECRLVNRFAAVVWNHCDGRSSMDDIVAALEAESGLPVDQGIVRAALEQLQAAELMDVVHLPPPSPLEDHTAVVLEALGFAGKTESPSDELLAAARCFSLDAATAEIVSTFEAAGVESILLKGPAIAGRLYAGRSRPYQDIDLLVPVAQAKRAESVLERLGFRNSFAGFSQNELPTKAVDWIGPGGANLDLHFTLAGVEADPERVWAELSHRTEEMPLAGATVRVPSRDAQAFIIALHAAHHGVSMSQPLQDLELALKGFPTTVWTEAVELASCLDASSAFVAGLELVPGGRELAERWLPGVHLDTQDLLSAQPRTAANLRQLARTGSWREKLSLVLGAFTHSPSYLRRRWPIANQGTWGLGLSYVWHPLYLLLNAPRDLRAWTRARKLARSKSGRHGRGRTE